MTNSEEACLRCRTPRVVGTDGYWVPCPVCAELDCAATAEYRERYPAPPAVARRHAGGVCSDCGDRRAACGCRS